MKTELQKELNSQVSYRDFVSRIMPFVPELTGAVRKRVGDVDAVSDIVQDALLSAWRARESLAGVRNPHAWMMTIAKRRVADYYRKKERHPEVLIDPAELLEHIADDRTYDLSRTPMPQLKRGINELQHSLKAHLFFFYLWGYNIKLLAEIYQCNEGLIRTRLSIARSTLKRICVVQQGFQEREMIGGGFYTKHKAVPEIGRSIRRAGTAKARIRTAVYDGSQELEIYLPPDQDGGSWPAVIFVMGIPDEVSRTWFGTTLNNLESHISWGETLAYHGIAMITYRTKEPGRDIENVFSYLHKFGGSIGIDTARMALWACSGNAGVALDALEKDFASRTGPLRFLMLYYPVLIPGEAIRPVSLARQGVPVMVVRVGEGDPAIDRKVGEFIEKYEAAGGEITSIVHGTGIHAFDAFDHGEASTEVVRRSIQYMKVRFDLG